MRLREVYAANVRPGDVIGGQVGVSERRPFAEMAYALSVGEVIKRYDESTGRLAAVTFVWDYSPGAVSPEHSPFDKLVVIEP